MLTYDMIAKIYPIAFAASKGVYIGDDGSNEYSHRSRLNTQQLFWIPPEGKDQFKQVLYVRSESRPICTTRVPSSDLNEDCNNDLNNQNYLIDDLDVNDDDIDYFLNNHHEDDIEDEHEDENGFIHLNKINNKKYVSEHNLNINNVSFFLLSFHVFVRLNMKLYISNG